MKPPKKRQKLCQNCDGEVDLDVIFCPYCGSDLLEEKPSEEDRQKLYPPPYAMKKTPIDLTQEPAQEEAVKEEAAKTPKNSFWALLLFSLGVQALLMGALLFIFSHKGVVHLQFDAKSWLFYIVFSMPMLYFGWKAVSQLD